MNAEQLTVELNKQGLRLASSSEAGWTYTYINCDSERITVWVTER